VIKPGDRIRLTPGNSYSSSSNVSKTRGNVHRQGVKREPLAKIVAQTTVKSVTNGKRSSSAAVPKTRYRNRQYLLWQWPIQRGRVVSHFEAADPAKRGLDIVGKTGQAIFAAADGEVVYSGGGLPRYGKLIIVKHNDVYLSAYAHNKKLYVAEGDAVRRGQHIADMGSSGSSRTQLHFEIRRNGKAVDPLYLLPKSKL